MSFCVAAFVIFTPMSGRSADSANWALHYLTFAASLSLQWDAGGESADIRRNS
jgi:hypothetical protein